MPSTVIISANVLFKVLALHYQRYGTFTLNGTGNENETRTGINGYQCIMQKCSHYTMTYGTVTLHGKVTGLIQGTGLAQQKTIGPGPCPCP